MAAGERLGDVVLEVGHLERDTPVSTRILHRPPRFDFQNTVTNMWSAASIAHGAEIPHFLLNVTKDLH